MKRLSAVALIGMGVMLLAGCGKELLAGGQREGEVSAVATDDGGGSASYGDGDGPSLSRAAEAALLSGTVEFVGTVAVAAEDGRMVPVTDGPATVTLRLTEPDTALLGRKRVPVGTYSLARVVFTRVSAEVKEGLVVDGTQLTGLIRVAIGSEPLVVEAPITMLVREDGRSTVVIDLNAAPWLTAADPITRTVSAAAFRAAVEVSAR